MLKKISHGCSYHLVQSSLVNAEPDFLHFIPVGAGSSPNTLNDSRSYTTASVAHATEISPTTHTLRGFLT